MSECAILAWHLKQLEKTKLTLPLSPAVLVERQKIASHLRKRKEQEQ